MRKKLAIIVSSLALVFGVSQASAQVTQNFWKITGTTLQPILNTWGLKVPQLNSSGTKCLHVDNTGLISAAGTDCSSGGGTPAGSDRDIQINNADAFGVQTGFNIQSDGTLSVPGDIVLTGLTANLYTPDNSSPDKITIAAGSSTSNSNTGGELIFISGNGFDTSDGGNINFNAGDAGANSGNGGLAQIFGGRGHGVGSFGGYALIEGGQGYSNASGGDVILRPGSGNGSGTNGLVKLHNPSNGINAKLDTSLLTTSDKTFTFPDVTGTLLVQDSGGTATGIAGQDFSIITPDSSAPKSIYINPGATLTGGSGTAGDVTISGGQGSGADTFGGSVYINGGNGADFYGPAGWVYISGGNTTDDDAAGHVVLQGGTGYYNSDGSFANDGGDVEIKGGASNAKNGGDVLISGGVPFAGTGSGGNARIMGGAGIGGGAVGQIRLEKSTSNPLAAILDVSNITSSDKTFTFQNQTGVIPSIPSPTLGDTIYSNGTNSFTKLAANTSTVQKFLSQTGDGVNSAAPSWQPMPAQGSLSYYFTPTASDLTNGSAIVTTDKKMLTAPYTPKTNIDIAHDATADVVLQTFATEPGFPGLTFIPAGQFEFHVHASVLSGTRNVTLYGVFREVTATGTNVGTIGTTEVTTNLGGSETEYRLYFVTANTYLMASATSRIVVDLHATFANGNNTTVRTYVGDEADTHIVLPSNTVDATNFVPYTGATATLNLGTHDIQMSGYLGTTGTRLTKGWFTDLQVTNAINGNITGNAGGTSANVTGVVALANGGTNSALSDPNANKILAWDDTDNTVGFWALGTGLSYNHSTHTLSASGGLPYLDYVALLTGNSDNSVSVTTIQNDFGVTFTYGDWNPDDTSFGITVPSDTFTAGKTAVFITAAYDNTAGTSPIDANAWVKDARTIVIGINGVDFGNGNGLLNSPIEIRVYP